LVLIFGASAVLKAVGILIMLAVASPIALIIILVFMLHD
jgi:hypothetical protein